jgi:hypothetical protein
VDVVTELEVELLAVPFPTVPLPALVYPEVEFNPGLVVYADELLELDVV